MERKGFAAAAVVGATVLLAAGLFAVGCSQGAQGQAGSQAASSQQPQAQAQAAEGTMAYWAELFPLQYGSSQQVRENAKGITLGHTVSNLRDICEAPVMRDINGDVEFSDDGMMSVFAYEFDEETGRYVLPELTADQLDVLNLKSGCLSCKTSKFNGIYAAQGASAYGHVYDAEAKAIVGYEYWDCAMCHAGTPGADTLSANLVYFQALGEGLADTLDAKIAVCAQCHNTYDYRSSIQTEEDLATFRPYRYGTDVDAVFESAYEDGVNFDEDPETGIRDSYVVHATVEGFVSTNHYKMGVTCVDCHMPVTVDEESGEAYTSHFAASSPLESDDALAYCLTCHTSQGIGNADEMVTFVRDKQASLASAMEQLEGRMADFRDKLERAIRSGSLMGAAKDEAIKLYAKASWYDCVLVTGPYESAGSQIAMLDSEGILQVANAAVDDGLALL